MQSNRIFSYSAALVILVTVCFGVGNARADVTGQISGAVKDPAGAMMAGVVVSVSNMDTGFQQTTKTDPQGVFGFPALPVGHYTLRALQKSFKEYGQEGLTLDVNTALRADIVLQLGAETQQVTVDASAVQVETASTQMGAVITSEKMTTVPINGRSYTDLLALQPGVTYSSSGQYGGLPISGDLNPGNLSVSGGRESANGFMVNGANVQEGANMGTAIILNLDSIAILASNSFMNTSGKDRK